MSPHLIVSYDGTPNDDDALALGQILSRTGASLELAYVRHVREFDPHREELAQHDAQRRLEQGAEWLGDLEIPRRVLVSASTNEGLEQLAGSEQASMIVFGSDYRTTPGRAEPGNTAERLLEGGPVAIAVAAAGLRTTPDAGLETIAVLAGGGAALQTAESLAEALGARLASATEGPAQLVVAGSQEGASPGTVALAGPTRSYLADLRGSVIVVPQGRPVLF